MADRPEHLALTTLVMAVGALVALLVNGTALLGQPVLLGPGLLGWPGVSPFLTILGFVLALLGLAAVGGLLAVRPWAPKLGAGLGLAALLAGLTAVFLVAPLKGFTYPVFDTVLWLSVSIAATWVILFCSRPDVLARYAEEEVFQAAPRAQAAGGESGSGGAAQGDAGADESAEAAGE